MSTLLKISTAATVKIGPFVDSTDGVTAKTELTIQKADVRLSLDGGNMAAAHSDQGAADAGAAHDELGYYDISLDTTDTATVGNLRMMISKSGALPVWADFTIVPAVVFDSLVAGTDNLQVDTMQLAGVAQSLTDLKDFADTGYDPATHKVSGVVLVDTTTTNTDMRGTDGAALASVWTITKAGYLDASIAGVAAAVWAVGTRTLSGFGSLIADIWAYATRSLTDKVGFTISGTKTTLDSLNDITSPTIPTVEQIRTEMEKSGTKLTLIDERIPAALVDGKISAVATVDTSGLATSADVADIRADISGLDVGAGTGANVWPYTVTLDGDPIYQALVEVFSNTVRTALVARGRTNTLGVVTFNLDSGTYYLNVWIPGQPLALDTEVV